MGYNKMLTVKIMHHNMKKWRLSKINQGYQMTKVNGEYVVCRDLNRFELITQKIKNCIRKIKL